MKIAIHQNKNIFDHPITWETEWIKYCNDNAIEYEVIDCFRTDIAKKLKEFKYLVWHYQNYVLQEMMFARSILNIAENLGIKVFPDFKTSWHYDDKVSETLLLDSVNSQIPKFWFFAEKKKALSWMEKSATFPIVAKLKTGAGSHNVKMIKNKSQGKSYVKKMFGSGLKASPSILFKASSNLKSAKTLEAKIERIKKIPSFLLTLTRAKRFGREKDYVYFQEFIPNDGFDIKLVVIGDKAFFLVRNIREGDFRASGGGNGVYDKELIPNNVIKSAFETSEKLNLQCMGYDYVVDKITKEGKIIEMSFGFSHTHLQGANGYWDKDIKWHNEYVNIPSLVIKSLLEENK